MKSLLDERTTGEWSSSSSEPWRALAVVNHGYGGAAIVTPTALWRKRWIWQERSDCPDLFKPVVLARWQRKTVDSGILYLWLLQGSVSIITEGAK